MAACEAEALVSRAVPPGEYAFIALGRLSPEKNYARLLEAFSTVLVEHPDTRLLILGTGPLDGELRSLASDLGIAHRVTFVGHVENPYPLMAACDCLVV